MRMALVLLIGSCLLLLSGPRTALAQHEGEPTPPPTPVQLPLTDRVLAERRVDSLPAAPLFWRLERSGSRADAEDAAGDYTLAGTDSAGAAWSATLAGSGGFTDAGPLPPVVAARYLLRLTEVTGPRGSTSPAVTLSGSAAIYVLAGEMCVRTAAGVARIPVGTSALAPAGDTPMQASSCGPTSLRALVLSVTDADRPQSSPARFPAAPAPPRGFESPGYEPTNPY